MTTTIRDITKQTTSLQFTYTPDAATPTEVLPAFTSNQMGTGPLATWTSGWTVPANNGMQLGSDIWTPHRKNKPGLDTILYQMIVENLDGTNTISSTSYPRLRIFGRLRGQSYWTNISQAIPSPALTPTTPSQAAGQGVLSATVSSRWVASMCYRTTSSALLYPEIYFQLDTLGVYSGAGQRFQYTFLITE